MNNFYKQIQPKIVDGNPRNEKLIITLKNNQKKLIHNQKKLIKHARIMNKVAIAFAVYCVIITIAMWLTC